MKKLILTVLLGVMMSTSVSLAQVDREITKYDPDTALHPFRLISLFARPPLAIVGIFVKGFYHVIDTDPIRRGFNIDTQRGLRIDEDY